MVPKNMAAPIITRATAERHPRQRARSATPRATPRATPLATRVDREAPNCSAVTVAGDVAGTILIESSLSRRQRTTGRDRPHQAGVAPARYRRRRMLPGCASPLASCSLTPTGSSSPRRRWWNPMARARQGFLSSDGRGSREVAGAHRREAHVLSFSQVAHHRLLHRSAHRLGMRRGARGCRRAMPLLRLPWPGCRVAAWTPRWGGLCGTFDGPASGAGYVRCHLAFGPAGSRANRLFPRTG